MAKQPQTTRAAAPPQADSRSLAVMLAGAASAADVLKSREILDMMELSAVPDNAKLVKGVLSTDEGDVPLVDLRIDLAAPWAACSRPAMALIVDVGGRSLGLILGLGSQV